MSLGTFLPLQFLEEFEKDGCYLFSKCVIEFTCEAIWSWTFVCWKIFNQSFNFIICDWSAHVCYFFLVQSWKVIPFSEFVHLFQVVHFIGIELLVVVSYDTLYFCGVRCNFSFFISNFIDLSPLPLFLDESG